MHTIGTLTAKPGTKHAGKTLHVLEQAKEYFWCVTTAGECVEVDRRDVARFDLSPAAMASERINSDLHRALGLVMG